MNRSAPEHSAPPCAALRGVVRHYKRKDQTVVALDRVDLDVHRGRLLALIGPSGSGKSTLLHLLGLLDTPSQGSYELDGEDVSALDDDARAQRRSEKIGFVFQSFNLISHLSLQENVELPLVYRGYDPEARRTLAASALARVGLDHRSEHLPEEVSGGEQQRAAIARALIHEPSLLLADEPTGNLDSVSADGILELVQEIHGSGTTVVLVTHNDRIAAIAEEIREIRDGRFA